jgi:hypothetical protein
MPDLVDVATNNCGGSDQPVGSTEATDRHGRSTGDIGNRFPGVDYDYSHDAQMEETQ